MMPAARVINDLDTVVRCLRDEDRYEEALDVELLIEAANRSGHQTPSEDGVTTSVRNTMKDLKLNNDTLELIETILH